MISFFLEYYKNLKDSLMLLYFLVLTHQQ